MPSGKRDRMSVGPGALDPWSAREGELADLFQVRVAILLEDLPQVQGVIIQQREDPALETSFHSY